MIQGARLLTDNSCYSSPPLPFHSSSSFFYVYFLFTYLPLPVITAPLLLSSRLSFLFFALFLLLSPYFCHVFIIKLPRTRFNPATGFLFVISEETERDDERLRGVIVPLWVAAMIHV